MRPTIIALLLALLLVIPAGCGRDTPETGATAQDTELPPTATTAPAATQPEPTATPPPAQTPEPAPTETQAPTQAPPATSGNVEEGVIAFISDELHGQATASGTLYDKDAMHAAHKELPFGTEVTVTNLFNGQTVVVTVVDRLPANNPHLIDVSTAAARELGMTEAGMVDGRIEW